MPNQRIPIINQLIKDLYLDLREKVNYWSTITNQTPQARMGYIGQHLVSVVTGYPGGKSGARGYDLVISRDCFNNVTQYGEIKTCYRVDQLGKCLNCKKPVSSLETVCSFCNSTNIQRNNDSKWLISIRNEEELEKILDPLYYYFVLFEFEEPNNLQNKNIIITIHQVDPKSKGFALAMLDYYFNIRDNAPLNLWPYQLKFLLTKPYLIYKAKITGDDQIETLYYYNREFPIYDGIFRLTPFHSAKILDINSIYQLRNYFRLDTQPNAQNKSLLLSEVDNIISKQNISVEFISDLLAEFIYLPKLKNHFYNIPQKIKSYFPPNYFNS